MCDDMVASGCAACRVADEQDLEECTLGLLAITAFGGLLLWVGCAVRNVACLVRAMH